MADAQYFWPSRDKSAVIGKDHDRRDGLAKSTGAAKYTYDINLDKMLIAQALGCPHAHCKINAIDINGAKAVSGVKHVLVLPQGKAGSEIRWQGELLAIVAAESEAAAAEGVSKIKVDYELLDSFATESDLAAAEKAKVTGRGGGKVVTQREPGDDDDEDEFVDAEIARLFKEAAHTVEGYYGIDAITHCCLEPHGSTVHWDGDRLIAYLSTQNVSGTDDGFARDLGITADKVDVHCQYIGGGFGSKFQPDYWGVAAAKIAQTTGRPVKLMLTRDQELKIAGSRPSGYLKVRLGADKDGNITIWDSQHWGSAGINGGGVSQGTIPYVYSPPNYRRNATTVKINAVRSRAWRAPNHPQACAISQTAIDDLAGAMGANSLEIFKKNLGTDDAPRVSGAKPSVYAAEIDIAAKLIDWNANWHPHGKGKAKGSVVEGLGLAIHTWGGTANNSSAKVKVYPDGSVETFCGSQDLGTGTRTVIAQVVAETFGLKADDIKVNIGISTYPDSGASGGSTTVGGVSESHRRAALDAVREIYKLAANKLNARVGQLEAAGGRIQVAGNANQSIGWKEACRLLGLKPLEASASHKRGDPSPLSSSGVGGCQMAHVAVDKETGVVKLRKFVAVQDQGLVINPKTCKSQIYGGVIMSIAAALFEHRILDGNSGAFVNAELSDYKLARLGDVGDIIVELYEPEDQRARGVIGNGEPPAISGVAAISNAICNALGVRVPVAPYTPQRVLEAIEKAGRA